MSIEIHTNNDGSVALDVIIEKNHGFEMWEIVQAIENHTIERCALVAEGFDATMNSDAMRDFQDHELANAIIQRDLAIGAAIRKLSPIRITRSAAVHLQECGRIKRAEPEPMQQQAWSSGNPVHTPDPDPTHPNNDKGHVLRTEGDEYICGKCHKRWGFDDTDVPDCV